MNRLEKYLQLVQLHNDGALVFGNLKWEIAERCYRYNECSMRDRCYGYFLSVEVCAFYGIFGEGK